MLHRLGIVGILGLDPVALVDMKHGKITEHRHKALFAVPVLVGIVHGYLFSKGNGAAVLTLADVAALGAALVKRQPFARSA